LDLAFIKSFESESMAILIANMKNDNLYILIEYIKDKINLIHKYLDIDGNVFCIVKLNELDILTSDFQSVN
jgi:hypothetical protein